MPSGGKPKRYDDELVRLVRSLYASGMTQGEVAVATGVTQKVIWKLMLRHGIKARTAAKRDQRGSKNHMWKGGAAAYAALHYRIQSLRGRPKRCEVCGRSGEGTYDWANLTGKYDDPGDYVRICRSCHHKHDGKHRNLGRHAEKRRDTN